jgi:hypothetical protein
MLSIWMQPPPEAKSHFHCSQTAANRKLSSARGGRSALPPTVNRRALLANFAVDVVPMDIAAARAAQPVATHLEHPFS